MYYIKVYYIQLIPTVIFGFFFLDRLIEQHSDVYIAIEKLRSGEWDGVVFTNEITINYFNLMNKSWNRIGYTRDKARLFPPVLFFNKHSILTYMFNRKVEICNESGLTSYWWRKYHQDNPKNNKEKKLKKLSIQNILAILRIAASLYLVAFIVFLLEIVSHQHKFIKKCLDYITY